MASPIVSATSEVRHRRTLLQWMISTWTVRAIYDLALYKPHEYHPALGITDEADLLELKGSKKKKGKKIDDPDFMVKKFILQEALSNMSNSQL